MRTVETRLCSDCGVQPTTAERCRRCANVAAWRRPRRPSSKSIRLDIPNQERTRIRMLTQAMVTCGVLVRPDRCEHCQKFKTDRVYYLRRIEAHHYDYEDPAHVVWLCIACHTDVHLWHKGMAGWHVVPRFRITREGSRYALVRLGHGGARLFEWPKVARTRPATNGYLYAAAE